MTGFPLNSTNGSGRSFAQLAAAGYRQSPIRSNFLVGNALLAPLRGRSWRSSNRPILISIKLVGIPSSDILLGRTTKQVTSQRPKLKHEL